MFLNSINKKFTFDDFLILPDFAEGDTRINSEATKTELFGYQMDVPIIAAPMDSICGFDMMVALRNCGAIGVHHRYGNINELYEIAGLQIGGIAISPSLGTDFVINIHRFYPNTFFCLDVAHAYSKKNVDFCKELINSGISNIIVGALGGLDAVASYLRIGVTHFRAGLGSGASCKTRTVCGIGYPQGSLIYDLYQEFGNNIKIISDGGHNSTADISKALSLGASFCMTGRMLAGTTQCPIKGVYRGMASPEALAPRKETFFAEGESMTIEDKGDVKNVIQEIKAAIQMTCYYAGVSHFSELKDTDKIFITQSSIIEGGVRK